MTGEGIQNEALKYWKSLNFVQRVYYFVQYRLAIIIAKIIKYTRFMYNAKKDQK